MHIHYFSPLCFFFISFFIFIDVAVCDDDANYSNCSKGFSCGNIKDIGYPFWGGDRPEYCGRPGYKLQCGDGDVPEIEIMSLTYEVLSLNEQTHTMSIVRIDFMDDPCPSNYINATLNTPLFRLITSSSTNLTLLYNCDASTPAPNRFYCSDDTAINYYYHLTEQIRPTCSYTIVVPVFRAAFDRLVRFESSVEQILKEGLDVEYVVEDSEFCKDCEDSSGMCGFDSASQKPTCFCFNGPSPRRRCLTRPPTKDSKRRITIITVGASAILATLVAISCILTRKFFSNKLMLFPKKKTGSAQNVEAFLMNYGSLSPGRYKYSDIKKMTNSFKHKLGQGGYGSVYKGKLLNGRMVAVKLLSESKGNGEEFINEVASISRTSHINVVTLIGFCVEGNKRALIYEFMSNGSLEKFIFDKINPRYLGWKTLYDIARGIARGLQYLHRGCNTRILHFDIKPHNILLDQNFCPKISDFGLSKLCLAKESIISMTGARGTAGYIAPELISRNFGAVSHKSDVYSYGMMVLEIVGGRKNADARATNSSQIYFPEWVYNHLDQSKGLGLQGVTTAEDEEISRKMVLVGLWCIQIDPSNRPPMNKVLDMLEGSLEELQIPPKPFLSSPPIPQEDLSSISISSSPRPQ